MIRREVAADVARQPALGAGLDRLDRAQRDVGARGVRLETAVVAAFAAAAVGVDRGVADLAGHVGGAVVELAVEDEPAADPGADGDADRVPRAPRRAHPPLAEDRAVGVVVELGGKPEPVANDLPQRQVDPAEVGREQHDAALGVERARRADADAEDLRAGQLPAGLARCTRSASATSRSTTSLGARLGVGRLGREAVQRAAVLGHAADDEVGSADVNAEDESHGAPPRPPPDRRLRPRSRPELRMQR